MSLHKFEPKFLTRGIFVQLLSIRDSRDSKEENVEWIVYLSFRNTDSFLENSDQVFIRRTKPWINDFIFFLLFFFKVLPDDFSISLCAFHSESIYHENVGFWSNVYGFEMNAVSKSILDDGHVLIVPVEDLMTDDFAIKVSEHFLELLRSIRCFFFRIWMFTIARTKTSLSAVRFPWKFNKTVRFRVSFRILTLRFRKISSKRWIEQKDFLFWKRIKNFLFLFQVHFSTSPRSTPTHWKQTVFLLPRVYSVQKGDEKR